jgi:polyferredoxin
VVHVHASLLQGGPAVPPEGQETLGCPVYSHPAQLTDNRNCVLCMTCLKACPHRSIEIRLRPPATDLWSGHQASWYEVFLMYMLLGAVYLHR